MPFAYDTSVTNVPSRQMAAQNAMAIVDALGPGGANFTFVPRTNESSWIVFVNDTSANFSPVGSKGGGQEIHIKNWGGLYTVVHEIMHSLGFWHEQSRSDRDTYVTINFPNICQTCCSGSCNSQFQLESGSDDYGPYDFGSVMHYSKCAFLSPSLFCTPQNYTITVKQPWTAQWQDAQRSRLSKVDSLSLVFLYALPDWRFVDINGPINGQNGSLLHPWADFESGVSDTPSGGRLFVQPGSYQVVFDNRLETAMRIHAPLGPVTISRAPSIAAAGRGSGAAAR